jgi:hypothetical protein
MGLWFYDGTLKGSRKPFAHVPSFLAQWWLREVGPNVTSLDGHGSLQIRSADTPIHAGYEYTAPGALFVGDSTYKSDALAFKVVNASATDVLLVYNSSTVRLLASADTLAAVDFTLLSPPLHVDPAQMSGTVGWSRWDGTEFESLLLEGEEVTFKTDQPRTLK